MGWLALLVALIGPAAGGVMAQGLPVAGGGEDTWVVLPEADRKLTILHRQVGDEPGHYWKVVTLPGVLVPGGVTAADGRFWLVYDNLMVQSMEVLPDPDLPQLRYNQAQFSKQLPEGLSVRSLAASSRTLWALVDVTSPAALASLDAPQADADATAATMPQTSPAEPAIQPLDVPEARLIRLEKGRWVSVPLPQGWSIASRAWVVFTDPAQAYPLLIAESKDQDQGRLVVHRHDGQAWQQQAYQADTQGDIVFLGVQQQLVMARKLPDAQRLRVTLSVLRPERSQAVTLGEVALDMPAASPWGAVAGGLHAMVVARQGKDGPVSAAMSLQGTIVEPPVPLKIEPPPVFVQDPGQMVLVGVVAISIFLMFVIWRRDPSQVEIVLPQGVALADFGRRIAAVAIDMVPCVFLAMLITGESLADLQRHWPGRSGSWMAMLPGLLTIALFVLHTGLSELFTGRTMGKALLGLKVISVDGQPPNLWQVLARNLLKIFDLVAFYILPILALVGRNRQRLGDLVGRTLVVMSSHKPPEGQEESSQRPPDED